MSARLNIAWLWPDILNLHGDRGNVMALVRQGARHGITVDVTRVRHLHDPLDLTSSDLVILGAGELAVLETLSHRMKADQPSLSSWRADGGVLLATGTTGALLGHEITRHDGTTIAGLALLDMRAKERTTILGDDLIFQTISPLRTGASDVITGSQIQMVDVTLAPSQQPFGKVQYGYGNDNTGGEGAARDNLIYTNALGPVLVKNPWLTDHLINRALLRAGYDTYTFDEDIYELEQHSAQAIHQFNEKKRKPPWLQF